MRVLHVIPGIWENTGGPAESVPELCSALKRAGCKVSLATLDGSLSDAALRCKDNGVALKTYRPGWRHTIWYSPAISKGISELAERVDIVHGHALWLYTNWMTAKWARRLGKPLLISPRGMLMPEPLKISSWKKRLSWALFDGPDVRSAACLHACSAAELQAIRNIGLSNPVALIPNGVEIESLPVPETFSRLFPSTSGKKVILFLSRLHPIKRPIELARAWAQVAGGFPDWHLVLAGPEQPAYGLELRAELRAFGIEKRTTITGPLYGADRWAAYSAANIFVLPTRTENFGMAIAEALAAGLPVITTRGAPWPQLLEHKCGWWIPMSLETLIESLREAMSLTDAQRKEMGERGRALVERDYTWDRIAAKILETYEWVLGQKPRPEWVKEV